MNNTTNNYLIPVIPFHNQILTRGKGSYVFDTEGKKYLDLNSGQFCTVLGHGNEELSERVKKISEALVHTSSGMLSEQVVIAADMLHRISGELKAHSILLSTGAEAVEFAMRYAKHITGKAGMVCFNKGYHGLTLGTQSVTFEGRYAFPQVNNIFSVPIPADDNEQECIATFEKTINEYGKDIAAAIMEPIVSVGGMLYPSSNYFKNVKEICNKNDILLIFDESQTGFGRTGEWFCYQKMNVIPDMVILSKGIGLGYPVSAVMFNEQLLERKITMTHYSSHQNDPMAAGLVQFGIEHIESEGLLEKNANNGELFLDKLTELSKEKNVFRNPRGVGLMLGLDLYLDGVDNYRNIYSDVYNQMADMGVLIQGTDGGRVLRFLPDYYIGEAEMDLCVNALKKVRF